MTLATAVLTLSGAFASAQAPYPSRVDLAFNHWYDYEEMTEALQKLADAYPELLTLESLGQSVGGREIWLMTLNNPETGPDTEKTAAFIDGNIHGNEIQAAETVLYSIWYLTKSYGKIDKITKLVDERAFYFVPMENPDGREIWFNQPATPHYQRGGIRPTDNDYDGLYDEDPYDDLDGDGHITQMWVRDPLGRWERDPDDDRFFIRVDEDDAPGGWTPVGSEGIDNDGDGSVNEDGPGGYDPNRNWPSDWQPEYIQFGAGDYPFSLPETRAIADFLKEHPNIAAFQSYHNAGGMILRGPGARYVSYPNQDIRVYDQLGQRGEELLPYYNYWIIHADLYTVHGGEVNWAYEGLGIFSFTNELWTDKRMFQKADGPTSEEREIFREWLQFDDVYVPYTEVDHPQYGKVLVGGTKKYSSRVTPPWLLEEGAHRNFAFTMFHADEMPRVEWGAAQIRRTNSGLWDLTIEVKNPKIIPTIAAIAWQKGIGERDSITVETGDGSSVVASGRVDSMLPWTKLDAGDSPQPERIWVDRGIGSKGAELFRFLIAGEGSVEVEYRSQKGGTIRKTLELAEMTPDAADEVSAP
ncbi:MAG: M14 family metallopeptidase [Phycisphaerales bacterium]